MGRYRMMRPFFIFLPFTKRVMTQTITDGVHIVLDSTLQPIAPWRDEQEARSIRYHALSHLGGEKKAKLIYDDLWGVRHQLGFVGLLSRAYSLHHKVEIAPHDLWYIVLSEIALLIKGNVEQCRPLFTTSDAKVEIIIPTDDPTRINLAMIVEELEHLMVTSPKLFIPHLSTFDPTSKLACYAALCDGVSPYYDYGTFLCGIPELRILGTNRDWELLTDHSKKLLEVFTTVNLTKATTYLQRVTDLFTEIGIARTSGDVTFWKNIFSQDNVGSGSQKDITGWITKLYTNYRRSMRLETCMATLSIVPYKNLDTGRKFKGVYGPFNCATTEDEFTSARYAQLIYELVA